MTPSFKIPAIFEALYPIEVNSNSGRVQTSSETCIRGKVETTVVDTASEFEPILRSFWDASKHAGKKDNNYIDF